MHEVVIAEGRRWAFGLCSLHVILPTVTQAAEPLAGKQKGELLQKCICAQVLVQDNRCVV